MGDSWKMARITNGEDWNNMRDVIRDVLLVGVMSHLIVRPSTHREGI